MIDLPPTYRISRLVWALTATGLAASALALLVAQVTLNRISEQRARTAAAEDRAAASFRDLRAARESVLVRSSLLFFADFFCKPLCFRGLR